MSTTIKSKKKPQTVSPMFKYKREQKVFYIIYHKGKPDDLVECVITARNSEDFTARDAEGKATGVEMVFTYDIRFSGGTDTLVPEDRLYPSFPEAAKAFAKPYLTLIK